VYITDIVPNKVAKANLRELLMMNMKKTARIIKPPLWSHDTEDSITLRILIEDGGDNQATALLGAIDYRGEEGFENAIWRAALTRVASRPADAVFSIMGLLGVNLDPLRYDSNDRKGPTIALMQALLHKGDRAEWLGAAPELDINPDVPTLPNFPTISPEGKALTLTKSGLRPISEAMGFTWWRLLSAPRGSMQDNGTLTIDTSILPVRRERHTPTDLEIRPAGYNSHDGQALGAEVWYPAPSEHEPPYIIQLGRKVPYTNGVMGMYQDGHPYLVMLVNGADDGMVRVAKYASVGQDVIDLASWKERAIVIASTM
jgi:hypothetical protein